MLSMAFNGYGVLVDLGGIRILYRVLRAKPNSRALHRTSRNCKPFPNRNSKFKGKCKKDISREPKKQNQRLVNYVIYDWGYGLINDPLSS